MKMILLEIIEYYRRKFKIFVQKCSFGFYFLFASGIFFQVWDSSILKSPSFLAFYNAVLILFYVEKSVDLLHTSSWTMEVLLYIKTFSIAIVGTWKNKEN